MAMPEFIKNVQAGAKNPTGWLSPTTVADLLDVDFNAMQHPQRERLYRAVDRFREIATGSSPTPELQAEARTALTVILDVLYPYLTLESEKVRETIVKVWQKDRDWIPTFDYQLGNNWLNQPVARIWLVVRDDALPEDMDDDSPTTWAGVLRVEKAISDEFNNTGIEHGPRPTVRTESGVRELTARATA